MKRIIVFIIALFLLQSCATKSFFEKEIKITIDTLLVDKISIRAITVLKDTVWYAANDSRVGCVFLKNRKHLETVINPISLTEYRSIAATTNSIFVLSVGNPAQLYKFSKDLKQKKLIYTENHNKVFYDSMQFYNAMEGIAIGDPTENCLSILLTKDGGTTWQKTPCQLLPKVADGEAAFAASNTNIVIKNNKTWIVSGGKKARVFYSDDKGNSWQVFDTPIVQGEEMTGIFTADFFDESIGFIAGGNYSKPNQNFSNKALTIDGGKTWKLVGENTGFGYASCIQFVPNSGGKKLVCVGSTGVFYSSNMGNTWLKLSECADFYTFRFIDKNTAIAAGKNIIAKLKLQ